MSRYATVALRSIILVRHTVRWRVGLIPVFRTRCSEIRTPSLLTGKLVLNQGSPSRSGDLVHIGGGTRESYRVRVERRDFARLLAHSRIKETGCRRQTRPESLGIEQSECRFASSREVEGSGPIGEGLDRRISSDRAGEGRGLAELCRSLGIHASAILVLFDHVHGDACPLSDYLQARFLHAQYHGICLWHICGCGLVE